MTEISRPWDGNNVLGDDGPYSAKQWQDTWSTLFGNDDVGSSNKVGLDRGVVKGALFELRVQEQSVPNATVRVRSGYGMSHGAWYHNDADVTVTPDANASGSTRYDVVVLDANFATNTVRIALIKGTPAAGVPSITQVIGTRFQIPLAALELANGFATITDDRIIDMRRWANVPDSLFVWVQNNSASVMEGGDLAHWDNTNDSSVTDSTTPGTPIAGVVEGRIPVSGWGRVQREGIGWVNLSDNVSRGDYLSQGDTSLKGGNYGGTVFGRALAAGTASEQVLASIDIDDRPAVREGDFKETGRSSDDGWLISDEKTIGNAASGGTSLAGTQSMSLFVHLWDSYTNATLPIQDSAGVPTTRGASAIADFNANKRMPLPDRRGRVFAARDNQGGNSANRVTDAQADLTGGVTGAETHQLVQAELPTYDVPTEVVGPQTPGSAAVSSTSVAANGTVVNANFWGGGDTPHNNIQPTIFGYVLIKL